MKKKFTSKVFSVLMLLFAFALSAQAVTWTCSGATYNSTTKAYEMVGVAEYYKGTSGGTATINTIADCHGSTSCITMGSSLFILKAETDLSGIVIYGNAGTGSSRTFASVLTLPTLSGTYVGLTSATGSGAITGAFATVPCAPDQVTIDFGTTITAGTYIQIKLSGNAYVAAIDLISAGPSNKCDITSFALPGQLSSTIVGTDITIEVPTSTDVTAITPTIAISAAASISPVEGPTDFTSPVTYTVTAEDLTTKTYTVTVNKVIPFPTIVAPSNTTQAVKQGVAIAPIVFTVTNAVGGSASGLPAGVTFDYASATISGTPTDVIGDYVYTVTIDGELGAVPASVTATGTITVKDPLAKTVAYVVNTALSANDTQIYPALNAIYDVTVLPIGGISISTDFSAYDLVILNEAPSSGSAGMKALWGINKPLLNFKTFAVNSGTWIFEGAAASNVTASTDVTVADATHPIFAGLSTLVSGNLPVLAGTSGNALQGNNFASAYNLATISGNAAVSIQEIPVGVDASGTATVAGVKSETSVAKYIQIGVADNSASKYTADGIQLVKNACEYLMGSTSYVSKIAQITSITVGGVTGVVNEATKTITVTVPMNTDVTTLPIVAKNSFRSSITTPASLTSVDCTNPVTITVQAEDTNAAPVSYTLTVTVSTDAASAVSNFKAYASNSSIIVEAEEGAIVSVVDMSGNVIYSGSETTISNLQSGVYAVSVNGVAQKVLVK